MPTPDRTLLLLPGAGFVGVVLAFRLADNAGGAAALAGVFSGGGEVAEAAFGVLVVEGCAAGELFDASVQGTRLLGFRGVFLFGAGCCFFLGHGWVPYSRDARIVGLLRVA